MDLSSVIIACTLSGIGGYFICLLITHTEQQNKVSKPKQKTKNHNLTIGSEWMLKSSLKGLENPFDIALPKNHCVITHISGDYVKYKYVGVNQSGTDSIEDFLNINITRQEFEKAVPSYSFDKEEQAV